jgi:hypothetical protein
MLHRFFVTASLCLALVSGALAASTNVGVYTLASRAITTALTSEAQTAITDLDGMTAVTLEANFAYGSGGTTANVIAQTSCDGGTAWRDVVRFDFTTATRVAYANLSGLTYKAVATYSALGSEGQNDGLLCNRLRAVITSTGTYVNTTLTLRASVR